MPNSNQPSLAEKYLVDDLPGAARVGARLNGILQKIDQGDTLTPLARSFLSENGLAALLAFTMDQLDRQAFQQVAAEERSERIRREKAKAEEEAAESAKRAEAMDAAIKARFAAMENDPVLRRKREARELRNRFDIGFVDEEHYPRVMRLLKQVAAEKRMQPEDVAWLSTEAPDCWTEKLQQAWHRVEALALSEDWERTGDVWAAVNASGHWRKADQPAKALELTGAALAISGLAGKPKSALSTTRGGAMRDVGRLAEAKKLGLDAHTLTPMDFRPCTLIGAVSMELGDLAAGHDWYNKAEKLGAERGAIDQDLRSLLVRSKPDAQERLRAFLLAQDPVRFGWLRNWGKKTIPQALSKPTR
ncbi:tetratricopeptide repeat protein [Hyphomonas atlantica]|uniref:hypothetical protein n=1 Tax=Hyphomonas atlantica TaxID=1280948 RepID=UPI003517F53D